MKKYLRIFFKTLKISIITILLLFLLVFILIQTPKFQNWLVQKVTTTLSETLQAKVSIRKVNLEFFKTAVLEGIYIEDQHADTLLFAEKLKTNIGLFSLFGKKIFLNKVQLEGAVSNITKKQNDSLFNFQFIIDGFSSNEPKSREEKDSTAGWAFGIGKVVIQNTKFNMSDQNNGGFELTTEVGSLEIDANELDFKNNTIELSDFNLENSTVAFTLLKNDQVVSSDSSAMVFPSFGWEIGADDLQLKNSYFYFSNLNYERQTDIVDYNYLGLEDITLKISDLSLKDTAINANIRQISVTDHCGFQLKNLSAEVSLNNEIIAANKVKIETPFTSLKSDIQLSFNDFGDLSDFMNAVKLEATFEPSQIAYQDITKLVAALRNIPVMETSINEKITLDGRIILQKNNILFKKFDAVIGKALMLRATGTIAQLTSDPFFDLDIKRLETDYASFTRLTKELQLPEGLAQFGKFNFSGQLKGTIADLKGKNLELITESATQFAGDLNIRGLPDIENTIFDVVAEELTTDAKDIEAISNTEFPAIIDSLGIIEFIGGFEGTIYDFVVNGDFQTSLGEMKTALDMNFEKDYQNANYEGNIEIVDFDLSKTIDSLFGPISCKIKAKGSGLNANDLDAVINGKITSFTFKGYNYNDLSVNGNFFKKRFEGHATAQDKNLQFDFEGMLDLNDSLPDAEIVLNIDTVNLKMLNILEDNLSFSGNLEADMKGNNLDNISGTANLKNFNIRKDSIFFAAQETISLKAFSPAFDQKVLQFRSKFMDVSFDGKFNFEDFPKSIIEFVNDFFPIEELALADSTFQNNNQIQEQDVVFSFLFKDVVPLVRVFLPEFTKADTAFINGNFNSTAKHLTFEGIFPNLIYGDLKTDSIQFSSNGTSNDLESTLAIQQLEVGDALNLPLIEFRTLFSNNILNFGLNILGDSEENAMVFRDTLTIEKDTKLDLKGTASIANNTLILSFLPAFVLNNDKWEIADTNKIEYKNHHLKFENLAFFRGLQEIKINSRGNIPENDYQPIEIEFANFNLEELSNVLGMDEDKISGLANGKLVLKEPKTNLHFNSNIFIDKLSYNENLVGKLNIDAKQSSFKDLLEVSLRLEGKHQMTVNGNYQLQEKIFDLDFRFGKLPLFLIDPFLKGIVKESNGLLSGEMTLTGSPSQPDVKGKLKLQDFSSTAVVSNMKYRFEETNIELSQKLVELGTIRLKDANDNDAILSGRIRHNYFDDITFDLNFDTEAFQFLKTTVAENELYFGNLFLKASVAVTGTPNLPKLSIDATTLPNTHLYVQPFSGEDAVKQEDYIIFANPEFYNEDSILLVEKRIGQTRIPFDLSLKLQATDEAILNIIVDPTTGDQLICAGTANLNVNISPTGVISVAGNYTIEKGSYSLNYEQLVKREFEIVKGSSIIFSGDPMNAAFDVTASYKVRASTYELLANQSILSESEKQSSSQRIDVIVLMILKGNINEPSITFDIQIPDTQDEGVSSALNRKLAELRTNPEELNKQAFGLLLFKSFITDSGSATSISDAGTNIALSSVSNLLTDQLNRFADKYVSGFEIDIGVESFTNGSQSTATTQMQLNVSKKLFQDRLTVNVGTNVNLNAENAGSIFQSNFSGITGDFVLEYKLTETGNYNVKVFHESDYNALEQNNAYKTGAGIIFRKSFNSKKYKY